LKTVKKTPREIRLILIPSEIRYLILINGEIRKFLFVILSTKNREKKNWVTKEINNVFFKVFLFEKILKNIF
jgi:hypothetical protein